jgi:hypothetical protein
MVAAMLEIELIVSKTVVAVENGLIVSEIGRLCQKWAGYVENGLEWAMWMGSGRGYVKNASVMKMRRNRLVTSKKSRLCQKWFVYVVMSEPSQSLKSLREAGRVER